MTDKQRITELERQVAKLEGKLEGMMVAGCHGHHCNCPQCTRLRVATTPICTSNLTITPTGPSNATLTIGEVADD